LRVTGVEDGRILRIRPDTLDVRTAADTGGRPLGIEFTPDGQLVVCDARQGLLMVNPKSGSVHTLVDRVHDEKMRLCDNAAVCDDGTIYFSDSSRRHNLAHCWFVWSTWWTCSPSRRVIDTRTA
jgi:sugar lactone lactonase YvrE